MSNISALALDLIGQDTLVLKDVVIRSEESCERACDVSYEVTFSKTFRGWLLRHFVADGFYLASRLLFKEVTTTV
jgi:hypothetical protein